MPSSDPRKKTTRKRTTTRKHAATKTVDTEVVETASTDSSNSVQPSQAQVLDTISGVHQEAFGVVRTLADQASEDARQIGQQSRSYVQRVAFSSFLEGYSEGDTQEQSPFLQLRQQLEASRPEPTNLLTLNGSTSLALLESSPQSL
ncbi:MAG: hypothetical protein AB8B99_18895 [Phormidesmis sp.]